MSKIDLREWKLTKGIESLIPFKDLQSRYFELCDVLNVSQKDISMRTFAEDRVLADLRRYTKLEIKRSMWIGPHSIDLFLPSIVGGNLNDAIKSHGLAIEVDGDVHNWESKIKKDHQKIHNIKKLGIAVCSILNEDSKEHTYRSILEHIGKCKRLDSRGKKRLLRNIYIYTMSVHLGDEEIVNTFGEESLWLFQKMRRAI